MAMRSCYFGRYLGSVSAYTYILRMHMHTAEEKSKFRTFVGTVQTCGQVRK